MKEAVNKVVSFVQRNKTHPTAQPITTGANTSAHANKSSTLPLYVKRAAEH